METLKNRKLAEVFGERKTMQKKRFLELAKHNNFVIINTDKKIEQSYDDLLNQIKKVLNI